MAKPECCFCCNPVEPDELVEICQTCLDWLEASCVPGPVEVVTGHDRSNALHLLDTIQDKGSDAVVPQVFDLIRKCISEGAKHGKCNCRSCRDKRASEKLKAWIRDSSIKVIDPKDVPAQMSGWNYRVVHRMLQISDYREDQYAIHEVYYDQDDQPINCTKEPVGSATETLEQLQENLVLMLQACEKPVLEYNEIGKPQID